MLPFIPPIIDRLWRLVFKQAPPEGLLAHVDQFILFGAGIGIAKVFSATTQIFLGRVLGPADYGQITVILILAGYFSIPVATGWGLAFTRIVAEEKDSDRTYGALRTLFALTLSLALVVGLCLFAFNGLLADRFNMSTAAMHMTVVMSLGYGWWILTKQVAQAYQAWPTYVRVEMGWSVVIFCFALILYFTGQMRVMTVCFAFVAGYLLAGGGAFRFFAKAMKYKASLAHLRRILSHGGFLLLNALIGMATFSIDRLLIHHALGDEQVGIYQAHFMATYGLINSVMTIILTYAFPLFCRDDNQHLRHTLQRANLLQYPLTLFFTLGIGALVLWLYSYPVSRPLFICLCMFCALQFHGQIKIWYLSSQGADTTRRVVSVHLIFLLINIITLLSLIPRMGLLAGGISLLVASFAALCALFLLDRRAI